MPRSLTFFLILLVVIGNVKSNSFDRVDSLQLCLRNSETTRDSIDLMNMLANEIMLEDTFLTLQYLTRVQEMSESEQYPKGMAQYYSLSGKMSEGRGNFEKSIDFYLQSLQLYDDLGNDKEKCRILNILGVLNSKKGDLDRTIAYYDSCQILAVATQDTSAFIDVGNNIARYHWVLIQNDSALLILNECMEYCIGKYQSKAAGIYHIKGDIYRRVNTKIALEYYWKALAVYEENKEYQQVAKVLNNIALIHYNIKDFPSAITQFLKVLEITEENNFEYEQAMALNNLGCSYGEIHQNDSALYYLNRSLALYSKMGSRSGIITSRASIGDIFMDKNILDSAIYQYNICLEVLKNYTNPHFSVVVKTSIANVWLKKKEYRTSVRYAREAYEESIKYDLKREQLAAGRILSEGLSKLGNHSNAYSILSSILTISDTLYNESRIKELTQLEMRYDFEIERTKIEQEQAQERILLVQDVKRQRIMRNYIIIVCILLVFIMSILYWNYRRNRKANKEKEALLKEIHHRVKNNLQIVSSLLNIQTEYLQDSHIIETIHESQSRVKAMALIHQLLYQEENFMRIDFRVYLNQLVETLSDIFQKPESKIDTNIIAEKIALDIDTSVPLGLIVNELVTNAYKYAFEDSKQGKITVELKKEDHEYELKVSDNGKGLKKDFDIENTNSMGLKLVNILSRQLYGKLSIESNKGTTVCLVFAETN